MMIPDYIIQLLKVYGNAYISDRRIAELGGIDAILEKLSRMGLDCIATRKEVKMLSEYDIPGEHKRSIDTILWMKESKENNREATALVLSGKLDEIEEESEGEE